MSTRTLGVAIASLVLAVAPFVASAQSYNYGNACGYSYPGYTNYTYSNNNYTCGPQTLLVYVQVLNQSNDYNGAAYTPGNVTVSVSGSNPSPASFVGSLNGTPVQLGVGPYSVAVSGAPANATATYSPGCSGTINANGQGPLCVITETFSANYYPYPTPYPYPYNTPAALTCAPAYQTVDIDQSATFTATGGTGGAWSTGYNWQTPDRNYLNIGPSLTTVFQSTGTQSVIVSNGTQSATCTVNIVGEGAPVVYTGSTPTTTYIPATTYVVPALPNTGFEPHTAAAIAFALALVGLAAIAAYPYVRKISLALLD